MKPMVKLLGNIHGNEVVGREVLLRLATYILSNSHLPRINNILEETDLHILVSLNPDGFDRSINGTCKGTIGKDNIHGAGVCTDLFDS